MGFSKAFAVLKLHPAALRRVLAERRRADRKAAGRIRALWAARRRREDWGDRELLLPVTIRLEEWTVECARRVAGCRQERYQRVLREWIEEAIRAFVRRNR